MGGVLTIVIFIVGIVGLFAYLKDKKYMIGCYCGCLVFFDLIFLFDLAIFIISSQDL